MPWTPDIKSVYARTAVLLVPSQWQEAFGRVALEAQVNGIPVVARNVGGLGEVLEPSGVLIAPEATAEVWAGEIERLLSDPAYYGQRSAAARANAARPEFDPRYQMERFLSLVSRA
jgi:glycosyltransferase involved in cell wall biosynthesis